MPRWHKDDKVSEAFEDLFRWLDLFGRAKGRQTTVLFIPFDKDQDMILWKADSPARVGTDLYLADEIKGLLSELISSKEVFFNKDEWYLHLDTHTEKAMIELSSALCMYQAYDSTLVIFPHSPDEPKYLMRRGRQVQNKDIVANIAEAFSQREAA